jgi:hypothetical protein
MASNISRLDDYLTKQRGLFGVLGDDLWFYILVFKQIVPDRFCDSLVTCGIPVPCQLHFHTTRQFLGEPGTCRETRCLIHFRAGREQE